MKKLLSILSLGSFAIAQAGFTDYLKSDCQLTDYQPIKSAVPAALTLGSFALAVSTESGWKKLKPAMITGIGAIVGAIAASRSHMPILDGVTIGSCFGMLFAVGDKKCNQNEKPFAFGFLTVPRLLGLGAAATLAGAVLLSPSAQSNN